MIKTYLIDSIISFKNNRHLLLVNKNIKNIPLFENKNMHTKKFEILISCKKNTQKSRKKIFSQI
jgi:hypothetical protein